MVTKIQIAGKLKFYSKPYGRQWKWRYQVHGHLTEKKLIIPKALENVKIYDPLHPETMPKEEKPKWVPSTLHPRHPVLEGFFPKMTIKDDPMYNQIPIKLFDKTVKFHAGIDQVCLLTKTKAVEGLPSLVKDCATEIEIHNSVKKNKKINTLKSILSKNLYLYK